MSEQHEVEVTLGYFEHWLSRSKFEYVNDLLRDFPVADAAPATLLAIVSITSHATKEQLPYRVFFVMNVEDRLTATLGAERTAKLLEHRR